MSILLTILLATVAGAETVEHDGVRIEASVRAHIFAWKVTNVDGPPIDRLEFTAHFCNEFEVPEGWTHESGAEHFHAWTDDPQQAIRPGRSGYFSARVSSRGAVLGEAPVRVGRRGETAPTTIDAVWSPVARSRSLIWLVPATMALLALLPCLRRLRQGT